VELHESCRTNKERKALRQADKQRYFVHQEVIATQQQGLEEYELPTPPTRLIILPAIFAATTKVLIIADTKLGALHRTLRRKLR